MVGIQASPIWVSAYFRGRTDELLVSGRARNFPLYLDHHWNIMTNTFHHTPSQKMVPAGWNLRIRFFRTPPGKRKLIWTKPIHLCRFYVNQMGGVLWWWFFVFCPMQLDNENYSHGSSSWWDVSLALAQSTIGVKAGYGANQAILRVWKEWFIFLASIFWHIVRKDIF